MHPYPIPEFGWVVGLDLANLAKSFILSLIVMTAVSVAILDLAGSQKYGRLFCKAEVHASAAVIWTKV